MTQASLWRQLARPLHFLLLKLKEQLARRNAVLTLRQSLDRYRGVGGWLIGLTLLVALLLWNWQLVVATIAGLLIMIVTYGAQQDASRVRQWLDWKPNSSQRQLVLAVAGGGVATLSTYMATTVWVASDNSWLAMGTILQGLATLAALFLLIWQRLDRFTTPQTDYDRMLTQLTEADPLKRLIAVRQATRWGRSDGWQDHDAAPAHLADCFRLMLNQETEPTIRAALLDGLQTLGDRDLGQQLSIPIVMKVHEE